MAQSFSSCCWWTCGPRGGRRWRCASGVAKPAQRPLPPHRVDELRAHQVAARKQPQEQGADGD
eukprot:2163741-Prymnesium_polylepis.1